MTAFIGCGLQTLLSRESYTFGPQCFEISGIVLGMILARLKLACRVCEVADMSLYRAGLATVVHGVLRVSECRVRVRHLARCRRISIDSTLSVGSPSDHSMYLRAYLLSTFKACNALCNSLRATLVNSRSCTYYNRYRN